jgi:glycosyltransferase involved in cell wall biosynthesis
MINIINIIGSPINGGVQNFLSAISNYDKKFNINRTIICIYSDKGTFKKEFLDRNIKVYYCPTILNDNGKRPYFFWKRIRIVLGKVLFLIKFSIILTKVKAKIIICHEPKNLFEMVLLSKLFSVRFVNHMHKEINYTKKINFFPFIFKNSFFISDSSELLKSNFKNLFSKKSIIENIPIITATSSLQKFLIKRKNNNRKNVRIGSIGRFNWEKNFKQVIEIAKLLKLKTDLKFIISIVGNGPDFNHINSLILNNKLEKIIILEGEKKNIEIINFLNNLDIYIQTSVSEGSPLTIKEAMAASLPVISSNVGGIYSLIKHNVDGFLVEKNNTNEFVNMIIKVTKMNLKEKSNLGDQARKSVLKRFSPETTATQYSNYIKKVLQ